MLRIKELISAKGLTQKAFADEIGISPQRLNNIVTGDAPVSQGALGKIATALGVEIWELYVNPVEIIKNAMDDDFVAMVRYKGKYYHADSIAELEKQISDWKSVETEK